LPSKRPLDRFNDIIFNIDAISRYIAVMTEAQFRDDQKTIDATERCLSRISEAPAKLGTLGEEVAPDQPWPAIRGVGNRLRHEYDVVDKGELWRIFTSDLQSLRVACDRSIKHLDMDEHDA
jgi:uncharacterized protein with HEPN domain